MGINKELFYKVAQAIEDEPQSYYQGWWAAAVYPEDIIDSLNSYRDGGRLLVAATCLASHEDAAMLDMTTPCGTAFCIAGHAVAQSGWEATWEQANFGTRVEWKDQKGKRRYESEIAVAAAAALGISEHMAEFLFSARWKPSFCTVPEALRAIGDGMSPHDATYRLGDKK